MRNKQKVLIVDDNPTNISFIADCLKELNVSIVFAINGFKAIDIVQEQDIDLILMDINMPQMDGFETVRKMNIATPVIYVTALNDKESILKAFNNGGVDYITKPFYPEELIARVTTHLRLVTLNKNLQIEVNHEIDKRKEQEKTILQQSKLAAMGEIIDAIAHQWKQPISIISLHVDLLQQKFEDGLLDKNYMDKFKEKISLKINHMTNTLNEFRTFFNPNKELHKFDVQTVCKKVLLLTQDEFINNGINIQIKEINQFSLIGIENEFIHLILNIINNSKDAFNEKNIERKKRNITITLKSDTKKHSIEIEDNAGGIPDEIINHIFEVNFTTKDNNQGSGIGLYLSNLIAQKYNGLLKVQNGKNGAIFTYIQER